MATSNKKAKLIIVFLTAAIVLSLILILLLRSVYEPMNGEIERQSTYNVTLDGATILAFNSVPKEIIDSLKEYIKDNGYNGKEIEFVFQNSPYTRYPDHPLQDNLYYVVQIKRNVGEIDYNYNRRSIYIGTMVIDKDGNIVEAQNLMTVDDLSKIQTVPNISFKEAAEIAREHLGIEESLPAEIWSWQFCAPYNDEWILCYKLRFKGNDNIVYIDGFSGEIIKQ